MDFHAVSDGNMIDGYYLDYVKAKQRADELNQFVEEYKEDFPHMRTTQWTVVELETED